MVEIINVTEDRRDGKDMRRMYGELMMKYFGENKDKGYSVNLIEATLGMSIREDGVETATLFLSPADKLIVYKDFRKEKLMEFGKEYERLSGIENLVIEKDFS